MAKGFDNDIFFKNINYLLKTKGIKIGELESYAEVSTGYISRVRKEENSKPGIDFIVKAAEKFEVNVDDLIGLDMEKLTNTEVYILNFLEKLDSDTKAEKLMWNRETTENLSKVDYDRQYEEVNHHLFSIENVKRVNGDKIVERNEIVFVSETFGCQTQINGDCYNMRLKNNAILYLMDIRRIPATFSESDESAKEVLIYKNGFSHFLGNTKNENFRDKIEALFATLAEYFRHPLIQSDIRSSIDAFMQDDLQDDPDPVDKSPKSGFGSDVPFDEEVPF